MTKRALFIGLILAGLLLLAASLPGCTFLKDHLVRIDGAGPVAGDPNTIIVPDGGWITLSPDGKTLTVFDRFGEVVWQGDPNADS